MANKIKFKLTIHEEAEFDLDELKSCLEIVDGNLKSLEYNNKRYFIQNWNMYSLPQGAQVNRLELHESMRNGDNEPDE